MWLSRSGHGAICVSMIALGLWAAPVAAAYPAGGPSAVMMCEGLDQTVSESEFDACYGVSKPGTLPTGFVQGTIIGGNADVLGAFWCGKDFTSSTQAFNVAGNGARVFPETISVGQSTQDGNPAYLGQVDNTSYRAEFRQVQPSVWYGYLYNGDQIVSRWELRPQ